MAYPPAPWSMHGDGWMSLFRVPEGAERPKGIYAAMMIRYAEPSPLTYHELLVGRMIDKSFTITDIWVDSVDSMHGGRDLWAIPKELAEFSFEMRETAVSTRLRAAASIDGQAIASCSFHDLAGAALRMPFKGATKQFRDDGSEVRAGLTGSAKALPCRGSWQFAPGGPLGWLHGRKPLVSSRMRRFQMSFG